MSDIEVIERLPFCIVKITGNITIENAIAIQNELEDTVVRSSSIGEIIVDLSNVKDVDPSGVSSIIAAMISARAKGIRVMLYHPAQQIQETMDQMEISNFFPLIFSEYDLMSRLPDS